MYSLLHLFHSTVRYFVLIFLLILIVRSLMGWMSKKEYTKMDDKVSLWLFILTHTQLMIGLILFFVSPLVIFSGASMKDSVARYWLVEHNSMMLIAIVLISIARISIKKIADSVAKHRRLFILNTIALVIILVAISMSGRGFFSLPA
ncbi:MAG: cytochrome B [Bacteroidia bacterium]|nr:cytochrome B [Bacteroidia bacterium]